MGGKVKLSDIIEGMEHQSDESSSYLNKETGEIVTIDDEEFTAAEDQEPIEDFPEWQRPSIKIAQEILQGEKGYVALPSEFDIHEYNIMEEFCLSRENKEVSDALYAAIKGHGAFGRFKDAIHRLDIAEDWYKYRDEAFKQIARDWCEENDIEFTDD